jgi:hypothetical protein
LAWFVVGRPRGPGPRSDGWRFGERIRPGRAAARPEERDRAHPVVTLAILHALVLARSLSTRTLPASADCRACGAMGRWKRRSSRVPLDQHGTAHRSGFRVPAIGRPPDLAVGCLGRRRALPDSSGARRGHRPRRQPGRNRRHAPALHGRHDLPPRTTSPWWSPSSGYCRDRRLLSRGVPPQGERARAAGIAARGRDHRRIGSTAVARGPRSALDLCLQSEAP